MKKILLGVSFSLCIVFIGAFYLGKQTTPATVANDVAHESQKYPLLAKRLFVENPSEPIINFTTLRKDLKNYYATNKLTGSLYFEYLPTGTSVRVDGDNQEVAASLAKLPIAMILYKTAELGKINLNDEIAIKEEWLDSSYGNLYKKGVGHKLTIRETAKIMLSESDNTALLAITDTINGKITESENPFSFLDADYTQNSDMTISIGARSYSSFLKCLYFSCYLEKKESEETLRYLTLSTYKSRLVAGINNDVAVAHKIGTFSDTTQSDCGIVYLENKHYLLCVMIDGPENSATDGHIANLSRITYDFLR